MWKKGRSRLFPANLLLVLSKKGYVVDSENIAASNAALNLLSLPFFIKCFILFSRLNLNPNLDQAFQNPKVNISLSSVQLFRLRSYTFLLWKTLYYFVNYYYFVIILELYFQPNGSVHPS